jgi:hypothetical protein
MNLRQRYELQRGLRANLNAPVHTSELRDPLAWAAAVAVCAAFLLLIAAIDYRDQLEEARECATATR